ncbi:hypothetical protein M427DRAFT_144751 [Gonapodya prolifera JEL478]|uniref:Tyrosine specific protein phosphatases domain-containing protein n=1 Tax=Gonapodya prolifera (strain JEL478) TaxID=1344416 RepID=A0A139AHV4_GONPJ|nr:hypothetical protein M427DRAFT_144751 [Gonapodya prolifera JEL478]|eukprot:KXS16396.1 hypothetical protein M427DRAFT_144751 [Gonapodya prolifera JEL478]
MANANIPAAQPLSLDITAEDGSGKADGTVADSASIFSWIRDRLRTNTPNSKPSTGAAKRPGFKAKPYSELIILNFRDLLAGKQTKDGKSLKSDIVFRSGTLDNATAADAERVLNVHKVRTLVDLRWPTEQHPNPHLHVHFAVSTAHPLDEKKRVLIPATVNGAASCYVWHKIDYSGPLAIVYWKATSILVKIKCLPNEDINESALLVISHRENHPVVFHCSAGKDCAGFTAALVLHIAGVDESVIAGDYTHTNREMAHLAPVLVPFLARSGMDESWVEAWLDEIGFREEDRERLRSACLEE